MFSSFLRFFALLFLGVLIATPATAQDEGPDPADVEMPSFNGSALVPATLSYDLTFSGGGQTSTSSSTVTISQTEVDGQSTWRIVNESDFGQGGSKGVLHIDQSTLLPISYEMENGSTNLTYADGSVSGTLGGGPGQSTSIDMSVDAPVLDGRSENLNVALASMELEEGQTIQFRILSPFDGDINVTTCTVTGTETVSVPAGSFEAYVVSFESEGDGPTSSGTLHLRTEAPHYTIAGELNIDTQQGSFTISRELTSIDVGGGE